MFIYIDTVLEQNKIKIITNTNTVELLANTIHVIPWIEFTIKITFTKLHRID